MTRDTATPATIEHEIGSSGRLDIKVLDWDLQLVGGPDDVVRVRDADDGWLPADLEVERGSASLSIHQPGRFLGSRDEGRRLIIDVPAGAAINVQTASGDVATSGLRGDQQFQTAAGALHLDEAAGEVAAETVSGVVVVRFDGSIGLAVKTVSGDVQLEGGIVERLKLTTTSGDIRLTSDLGPGPHGIVTVSGDVWLLTNRGLRITAVTVAGDLRSDLPHTSPGGPGRRSLVVGDGTAELQFRSVSGDLRVLDPAAPGNGGGPSSPMPPVMPDPPNPPAPPTAPQPPEFHATEAGETEGPDTTEPDTIETERLEILQALESGEIDVAEATERLARLDGATND